MAFNYIDNLSIYERFSEERLMQQLEYELELEQKERMINHYNDTKAELDD